MDSGLNRKKRKLNAIPLNASMPYEKLACILALDKIFQESNITQLK